MEFVVVFLIVLAAAVAVAYPLLRGPKATGAKTSGALEPDALDALVERYRAAVRAGTVCEACREANPPGSRYCADCGRRLRNEDAA